MGLGLLGLAAPASAFESAVPERFFGVSSPSIYTMSFDGRSGLRDMALGHIQAAGIDSVRTEAGWADVEPTPPGAAGHTYNWNGMDRHVEALARKGQTWLPNLKAPPSWARIGGSCGRRSGIGPGAIAAFADFAAAFAARYGVGGSFWASAPADLPQLPVRIYEIWNEPNWQPYWCPTPDPETYGLVAAAAGEAIHALDPGATVAIGGLALLKTSQHYGDGRLQGMATERFLERATAAAPDLVANVDAVALHPYRPDPDLDVGMLGWARRLLERVGLGDERMLISEFGWNQLDYNQANRAEMISRVVNQFARTDCDVLAIYAHSWISDQINANNRDHWWGMAYPRSGAPYASGRAYADQIELFEGRGATPPPTERVPACEGDGSAPAKPRVHPPRVPDGFFGAFVTKWPAPWKKRAQFESMRTANLGRVRLLAAWSAIEPVAAGLAGYELFTAGLDDQVTLLALKGIGIVPAFSSRPGWAATAPGGPEAAYVRFMETFAQRYGAGGAFWDESRHLDADLAPRRFEIWSLANLGSSWWDGNAAAPRYASLYASARDALRRVDPGADAVASLAETGSGGKADAYIRSMVAASPELRGNLDAVYVQTTSRRTPASIQALVADVRAALDETGNADAEIHLGFGAPINGVGSMSDGARAALYSQVSDWAARSDCGVEGLIAYTWTSAQRSYWNTWDWFGIANVNTAALTATGVAYRDSAATFTGLSSTPAPRATLHTCNRPAPDRDGDGYPDEAEDYPLDPTRHP